MNLSTGKRGFSAPKKSLGQNFLQDPNIIRKIVEAVSIKDGDTVIEIGPGRGALTEQIMMLTQNCHVIEIDKELVEYWQNRADLNSGLSVHAQDVLKFNFQEIIQQASAKVKVIGNLPYNISSPVLFHLMQYANDLASQTVMLQKEVVDRMVAEPGSKIYGRLSVMLQQRYQIERLFRVPAAAFFPVPKVESAIAQLTRNTQASKSGKAYVEDLTTFSMIVKQAFSQRRKTLRNTLKTVLDAEQIESLGIDPSVRAETLGVDKFVQLANLAGRL